MTVFSALRFRFVEAIAEPPSRRPDGFANIRAL
jgi:hypothetical protein